ncbi:cytochrome c biogenesis protein ResB [Skermania sp. ID1734]|nr:cytochrome c biogenesis protein ResB [Skermania sp. ID1734]
MRTALVLLFLLAVAAVPGALLPQRSLNAQKVADYIAMHPRLGPLLDRAEAFDVFASFWFTAIYVLLFVSLIGCVIPRLRDHAAALRARPVRAPRNLARLPHFQAGKMTGTPTQVADVIVDRLARWRRSVRTEPDGVVTVSAEKGYLREAGNLVFHFSLIGLLVAVAVGKLYGYEGSVIVIADGGPGFCSTSPAAFDSFRAGNATNGTGLQPLCIDVKDFTADYLPNGQAQMFTSNIAYQAGPDLGTATWRDYRLRVNSPLRIEGLRVYLTGHGYAPQFSVIYPGGQVRTQALQFRPDDAATFLSSGALRFDPPPGTYRNENDRRRNEVAIEGLFAPTALFDGNLLSSSFPAMRDPAVAVDVYRGDTGLDSGRAQSIFALDHTMIAEGRLVKQARVNLRPGQSTTLSDGTRVRFDGAKEFLNLQVSHNPAQGWVLISAISMMLGLVVSLTIRRRRIWARIRTDSAGRSAVEIAGLARTDHAGWGPEFTRLCTYLFHPR